MANELILTATAYYKEQTHDFEFNACSDATDPGSLLDLAKEYFEDEEDYDESLVTVEITDYKDVHESYNDKGMWEYAEDFGNSSLDQTTFNAGIECGTRLSDVDEAYAGTFRSDKDFAQGMADQLDAIDNDAKWPMNCIDWDLAASELMHDYSEEDGHYFRNF